MSLSEESTLGKHQCAMGKFFLLLFFTNFTRTMEAFRVGKCLFLKKSRKRQAKRVYFVNNTETL